MEPRDDTCGPMQSLPADDASLPYGETSESTYEQRLMAVWNYLHFRYGVAREGGTDGGA